MISPALSTIDGVGQVQVFGSQQIRGSRRGRSDGRSPARGIGVDQVTTAVVRGNSIAPVGTVQGPDQNLAIEADTQMANADEFRDRSSSRRRTASRCGWATSRG